MKGTGTNRTIIAVCAYIIAILSINKDKKNAHGVFYVNVTF